MTDKRFYVVKNKSGDVDFEQLENYVVYTNEKYLNIGDKEVVLFIKEKIKDPKFLGTINEDYKGTIKVINGFEELEEFLK